MSNAHEQETSLFQRLVIDPFRLRPRAKTMAMFYQQLAALLGAGLPVLRALETLGDQFGPGILRRRLPAMQDHIHQGGDLGGAFARFPEVFGPVAIAMIHAGERAGRLEEVFARLAESNRRRARLTSKFIAGVLYPALLLHVAVLAVPLVQKLQTPELSYWQLALPRIGILYGALFVLFLAPRMMRATPSGAYVLDLLRSVVPVYGMVAEKLALARFARALGGLYGSGTELARAVAIAGAACGDEPLRRRAESVSYAVEDGTPLHAALTEAGGFPSPFLNMVTTGENSGRLAEMLANAAEYYADEAETALTRLVVVLPIVIYLGVAVYLGYEIVQAYAGLLNRTVGEPLKAIENLP
ncbi:MAG: type II secretion system F family protein [Planctomycetota bacterium]